MRKIDRYRREGKGKEEVCKEKKEKGKKQREKMLEIEESRG